jgi:uncharacterized membrane protein
MVATHTVLALLENAEHTERVVHALQEAGFSDKEISIVMRDWSQEREPGKARASLMVKGAIAGAVAGATPGLLATVASFLVPGLGWVQAVGPLVAVLGATPGVLFGAGVGAIGDSLLPEETSRLYQERLNQGHVLLAVHMRQKEAPRVESILSQHGAQEIFRTV